MTLIPKPITVIGGGLAGLSAGIHLLKKNVPTLILEAGEYPRHRVCGEFLSGNGREVLHRLGLEGRCFQAGARVARSVRFCTELKCGPNILLPEDALCISRFRLDHLLAEEFVRLGGELRTGQRWAGLATEPGFILASGRRPLIREQKWRWVGLKAHAKGVELDADLEMHFFDGGYVGISDLGEGLVNVCGAFRTCAPLLRARQDWRECLKGAEGTRRRHRLRHARFLTDTFRSVAGLGLERRRNDPDEGARIGDGWDMIAPVSGNGMSMALEGGFMAAQPLAAYSRGDLGWNAAVERIRKQNEQRFGARLAVAHVLQKGLLRSSIRSLLLAGMRPWLFRVMFRLTR